MGGAMNRKRRIEITVENRLLIIRRSVLAPLWCTECPAPVQMITPEEAAVLTDASTRAIYARVEDGQFHFVETPDGRLLICPNSLFTSTTPKEKTHA
jgi:hypothetical protein